MTKLAGVVLFDTELGYSVLSHNLSAEDAKAEVERLRADHIPAFTLEQAQFHGTDEGDMDAEGCKACQRNVRHAMREGAEKAKALVGKAVTERPERPEEASMSDQERSCKDTAALLNRALDVLEILPCNDCNGHGKLDESFVASEAVKRPSLPCDGCGKARGGTEADRILHTFETEGA